MIRSGQLVARKAGRRTLVARRFGTAACKPCRRSSPPLSVDAAPGLSGIRFHEGWRRSRGTRFASKGPVPVRGRTPPPNLRSASTRRGAGRRRPPTSGCLHDHPPPLSEDSRRGDEAALAAGEKVILVAPTGAGKTVMGAAIAKHAAEQHRGVLFLAHRREIIDQTSRKLHAYGVRHGVIMAGADDRLRPMECVQVASVATLWSRGYALGRNADAGGRPDHRRRMPPRPCQHLHQDHRALSRRQGARADCHAVSW